MHIGLVTDSLGQCSFDDVLQTCKELGITDLEIGCGNWSSAPHIDVDRMLEDDDFCKAYVGKVKSYGLRIGTLNCSGNPLAPLYGKEHDLATRKTFRLAEKLGVTRIVMMSGLPGGPGDAHPNWITTHFPPEVYDILQYQWQDVTIPYWKSLIPYARAHGIQKIALEMHGWQLVYNTRTFRQLVDGVGGCSDLLGINMDPSHAFWMGADPLQMIRELSGSIFHAHLKDVRYNPDTQALNSNIDYLPGEQLRARSWNFVIPGRGHDELWWHTFTQELLLSGYDGVLSIEMEDHSGTPKASLAQAVSFMHRFVNPPN